MSSNEPENPNADEAVPKPANGRLWLYLIIGLVLIAGCIGVMPVQTGKSHGQMRTVLARKTASDLCSAIMMYQTEYRKFPALPGVSTNADSVIDTSASSGIISVLVAMRNNPMVEKENRRQIQYFSDKAAKSPTKPGIYRSGIDAQLKDPWGHYYLYYLDTNNDGKIEITYPDGKVEVLNTAAAVRTLGPNGLMDRTSGAKNDDILSQ